ncbi:MAG: lamin tail domain-containing protein [Planctomycetia bacterium]|nr:lamin tail domain-containing protein [Planctomycetia bacterium]
MSLKSISAAVLAAAKTAAVLAAAKTAAVVLLALWLLFAGWSWAEERVRVATYNIKFLNEATLPDQGNRAAKLKEVIDKLDADVIGLEEIDDRAALEAVFDATQWSLIIDDDSGDDQDVAIAVRKPFRALGVGDDLDADDANFLFPASSVDSRFPNRRDVLAIEIQVPNGAGTFFVMVVHAKSRFDGRANTDARRENAARALIQVLEQRFDERDFVLVGDFNDNPDDRSLNILETGDPNAAGGAEETDGPFLVNLSESLCAAGHVSHGRNSNDIVNDRINTVDATSRQRNNSARGSNDNTGDILFDQILIPLRMRERYVGDSVRVFDDPVAVQGNSNNRASDHLPVYAEFIFAARGDGASAAAVRIASLLPNPAGDDAGKEEVVLKNSSSAAVDLAGWKLVDRGGNEFPLTGSVAAGGEKSIRLPPSKLPLNNSGDQVSLFDAGGTERHRVTYTAAQATSGSVVVFP